MRIWIGAIATCLGLLAASGACAVSPASAVPPRPNIIVIQTDDQNAVELNHKTMPATERLVAAHGTTFSDYVVATPLCCPSRATLITGQYPHNNGVTANNPGYPSLLDPQSTLPAWLQAAGYRTAHVGKYLNAYSVSSGSIAVPAPGWDEWASLIDQSTYYNYYLGVDGVLVHRGSAPRDYVTRALNHQAIDLVKRWGSQRRPFYLQLDERAPHQAPTNPVYEPCPAGPIPDPRDANAFSHRPLPSPPSFNEANTSDKPEVIKRLAPLDDRTIVHTTHTYRCRLASLRAVDRGVAAMHRALLATRSLRRTVVIFTSDNGFFQGEHRIARGKTVPYYEAIHEPMAIRLPPAYGGRRQPRAVGAIAANIDVAPTVLKLAGATPCVAPGNCRTLDGRSLVPLLRGRNPGWAQARPILVEYKQDTGHVNQRGVCAYQGVYTSNASFVHYTSAATLTDPNCVATDQSELYDLAGDPFQLQNLYPAPAGTPAAFLQARLQSQLAQLGDCAGIAGRDPAPASGHYCQ